MPHNDDDDFFEVPPNFDMPPSGFIEERKVIPFHDVLEAQLARPRRLRPIDLARWDGMPVPDPDWTVHERIPRRQIALFSGEGAMGKSTLLLQLACAHACAKDWLHTMPEPGPAIFIDAEDDEEVLHRRAAAVARHYRVRFADMVGGGLHLISMAGLDTVLAATNRRTGRVEITENYSELLAMVADVKPVMLGLASSANFFAGNENERGEVQQFLSLLARLAVMANGSVVLVSHPSLTGIASGSGMSGSTAWHNAVRARFFLHGVKQQEGSDTEPVGDLREIEFKKNNFGPVADKIVLRWRDGLFLPEPKPSTLQLASQNARDDEALLKALVQLMERGGNASPYKGPTYAPSVLMEMPAAKHAHVTGFRLKLAMDRLLEGGQLQIQEFGPPSRRRHRLVQR